MTNARSKCRIALVRACALIAWSAALQAVAATSVVDDTGAVVTLAAPARRIVTLAPHAAELVVAAGAGARIVGVIRGTDFPPEVAARPIVGDATVLDLERIVTLAPDLIVTWPWTTPAQVAWLREHGTAVFEADPRSLDGIADDVDRIGALAGTTSVAGLAARALRDRIAHATRDTGAQAPLRVFYQVSDAPLFTLGGQHLVSQALARCGGANIFGSLTIPAPQVSVEAVVAADPQVIIAGTDGARRPSWLDRWTAWPALSAVRSGNLHVVDANLLHRPGPRFVDGVAQLCDVMTRARAAAR